MKVNFKRVATAALAVAMSLSLSVPAFAAGNGGNKNLTVSGDTLDNKKVYAVQMFDARLTEGANNTFDNYELVNAEKWLEFFTAGTGAGGMGLTDQDKDDDIDADDARAYLEKMTNESTEVKAFADKAQAWVRGHAGDFEVIASDSEDPAVADEETFKNLKPGYYLVYPEGGSTGNDSRGTDAMLVNVPTDGNAEWAMKSTFPTVEKTVEDNNENTTGDGANGSAQVGDTVTFKLETTITDLSDFDKYRLAFVDELSDGLTYVDGSVKVYHLAGGTGELSDDKLLTQGIQYTVTKTDVLKIELTDVLDETKGIAGIKAGDKIVVTYDATINSNAIEVDYVNNKVHLDYSNNPDGSGHGTSTPDESKVYTYDINVHKYANDVPYLANAVFALSKNGSLGTLSMGTGADANKVVDAQGDSVEEDLIALEDNGDPADGTSYVVDPDGTNYTFTTNGTGAIKVQGLEVGTYYLYEVTAPASYNKLKNPVKIEITLEGGDYTKPVYKVTINGATTTGTQGDSTINVENNQGIELPETGSIGTIGLTALGVVVVVAGLFAFPRKKKTRQD